MVRDFVSLFITDDFYSILIGDYVFKFEFKHQLKVTVFINCCIVVFIRIVSHFKVKNDEMFGQIQKMKFNESNAEKMKYWFKIAEKSISYSLLFSGFIVSFGLLSMSCSYIQLFTFGLFWSISFALFGFVVTNQYLWNIVYLSVSCYYSFHLLKGMNRKIERVLKQNKVIPSLQAIPILKSIDSTHRQIRNFNEFWSLVVLINWNGLVLMAAIHFITAFFGEIDNILVKSIFIFSFLILSTLVLMIVIFGSSVVVEAKKTYKLLTKLNASKRLRIFLRLKIKVRN